MTGRVVFEVNNTWTSILDSDEFILEVLTKESSYPTPQAMAYKTGWRSPEGEGSGWDGWIRLLKRPRTLFPYFPTGLLPRLSRVCRKFRYQLEVHDQRKRPQEGLPEFPKIELRDYQEAAVEAGLRAGRGVFDMPPRCHDPNDVVLRADGTPVVAKAVRVGDALLGPDGKPRQVLEVHKGTAPMYRVAPTWAPPFTVTGNHVLVVEQHQRHGGPTHRVWTRTAEELTVEQWFGLAKSVRRKLYLLYAAVDFSTAKLPIPPYEFGVFLGDGSMRSSSPNIASGVPEIQQVAYRLAELFDQEVRVQHDKAGVRVPSFYIVKKGNTKKRPNVFTEALRKLGIWPAHSRQKAIPPVYLTADRQQRLELLAGLLDTDGYLDPHGGYEFSTASFQMSKDVAFVARSLGFSVSVAPKVMSAWTYYRLKIMGEVDALPLRVMKKKTYQKVRWRTPGRTSFTIEPLGEGAYCGWTLDQDSRYLNDAFLVLHNSGKTRTVLELQRRLGLPTLWIAPTDRIVQQTARVVEEHFGKNYVYHLIGSRPSRLDQAARSKITVCTAATAAGLPAEFYQTRQVLIVDEMHHSPAKTYTSDIVPKCDHIFYRFGLTGTFFRSGHDAMAMHGVLSNTIYKVTPDELLRRGFLVPTKVAFVPVPKHPKLRGAGNQFNGGFGQAGIHEHKVRNHMVAQAALLLYQTGRKVLILVGTKAQGRELRHVLAQFLPDPPSGCEFQPVEFLSTDRPRDIQTRILDSFLTNQEVKILMGTSLLGEGVDLPNVDALVYARGEKAEVSMTQNAYRVCTAVPGKTNAVIIDFADRHHRRLLEHSTQRLLTYYDEPTFEVSVLHDLNLLPGWLQAGMPPTVDFFG